MSEKQGLAVFEKYLSVWVALCIVAGIGIGWLFPAVPAVLKRAEVAHVSIPIAILIWLMIYPKMLRVDFPKETRNCRSDRGRIRHLGAR